MDGVVHDVLLIAWALHVAVHAEDAGVEVESLLETDSDLIASWQAMWDAKEHGGYCTDEMYSCEVCRRERLVHEADAVLNALPE